MTQKAAQNHLSGLFEHRSQSRLWNRHSIRLRLLLADAPENLERKCDKVNSERGDVCNHPRVEMDAWGQRRHGGILCNQWMNTGGEWLRLPEEDIAALRGLRWQRQNANG